MKKIKKLELKDYATQVAENTWRSSLPPVIIDKINEIVDHLNSQEATGGSQPPQETTNKKK